MRVNLKDKIIKKQKNKMSKMPKIQIINKKKKNKMRKNTKKYSLMNGKWSRINKEIRHSQIWREKVSLETKDQNLVSIKRMARMRSKKLNNYHRITCKGKIV